MAFSNRSIARELREKKARGETLTHREYNIIAKDDYYNKLRGTKPLSIRNNGTHATSDATFKKKRYSRFT